MGLFYDGWILPLIYTVGFTLTLRLKHSHWLIARATSGIALLGICLIICTKIVSYFVAGAHTDALGLTVALLVALLGWVVTNYSMRYLAGESHEAACVRNLLLTLACVSVLVTSTNLLIIALAWGFVSLGLHRLLTFYPERKAAQIVAHKKFIACRLADASMLLALALVFSVTGSFDLTTIDATIRATLASSEGLPAAFQWAMGFIALAAIIRSAQLPLHGWLIQVMEAPTPVSALLHAGIVNMGGFVLIRLAGWLSSVPFAQTMLVVVGSLTAALAGMVMMTRVSIKVRLAWSTCAQMGFMLMEIGLGLYELALLHLLAHSLYKSYAFLAAGDRVNQAIHQDLLARTNPFKDSLGGGHASTRVHTCENNFSNPIPWHIASVFVAGFLIAISVKCWNIFFPTTHLTTATVVILALGFAPLLWFEGTRAKGAMVRGLASILGLTQLYLLWHMCFYSLLPAPQSSETWLGLWAVLCISSLFGLQSWLRAYPTGRVAATLYPWAYCGFYLDELFTRLTFKIWPIHLTPIQAQTLVHRQSDHLEGLS